MAQDFGWLPSEEPKRPSRNEHRATFWTMCGPSNQPLTCAAYRVETGIELRATYGPENIMATQLFRGPDADERLAATADTWRLNLLLKGFREVDERGNEIEDEIEDRR